MEPGKEMHFVTRGKGTNLPHCTEAMILFNFGSKNILKVWFFGVFFLMTQFLRIKVLECGTSFLIPDGFPHVRDMLFSAYSRSQTHGYGLHPTISYRLGQLVLQ